MVFAPKWPQIQHWPRSRVITATLNAASLIPPGVVTAMHPGYATSKRTLIISGCK